MNEIEVSTRHLELSDVYMYDALRGNLSPRGHFDAVLDSGYFALLSVLTSEERRAYEHPSAQVVEIATARLGLDSEPGASLQRLRYSGEEPPSISLAIAWVNSVRARVRELCIE